MAKVVLLAINAKYVHSSLSVWLIAEGVSHFSRFPHEVSVIEATINQKVNEIVNSVSEQNPEIIGISTYIWNAGMLPEVIARLREQLPGTVIVLGGPEASNNIEYWLKNGVDYVLVGEGEYIFPQFLDAFAEKRQGDGSSVSVAEDNSSLNKKKTEEPSLCLPINPYSNTYFKTLNGRLSYIETSRGCPFECSFCLSAGSSVKYFTLDIVKEQILKLSQANTKTIKFVDRTFNCNAIRAFEIFEYVINLNTDCKFHFEVAADLFNERTLLLLETAPVGRIQFEIGLQSFHEPALNAVSRQIDISKAGRNIRFLLKAHNIHIHIDLIAGLPYETLADLQNSFNRAYKLNTHTLQLGFLKLLHGSELRKQADSLGIQYLNEPPYEIMSSSWLSTDDLLVLKQVENALQNTRNKNRFLSTLHYVLSATGKTPFSLMHSLGASVPNHGTQLEEYIVQIYEFFKGLPGVDDNDLKDCMIYDWLGMVKGKNTPAFLKTDYKQRKKIAETAEKIFERKIRREEFSVLHSGNGIFVDRNDCDLVTGLYNVYICE